MAAKDDIKLAKEDVRKEEIKVVKNERGIGTGETRSGVEPRPNADGSLPPLGNARNPAIVTDPAHEKPDKDEG